MLGYKRWISAIITICFSIIIFGGLSLWSSKGIISVDASGTEMHFTLLHTNDEHSQFIPHSPSVDYSPDKENSSIGGYPRLATAIKAIRSEKKLQGEDVLLVSAGDFIGGTGYSWLIPMGYSAELKIKHYLGYDVAIIGNHEYDYGTDILTNYLRSAGYPGAHNITPILATNTAADSDHPMVNDNLLKKYYIKKLENGLKVGFMGLIGEDAISLAYSTDPFSFEDQHKVAQEAVAYLRAEGADVIIALTHFGVDEDKALAKAVPEINLIVGGHDHESLMEPIILGDTIIVQAGGYIEYLGRLELAYNPELGRLRLRNEEKNLSYLIPMDSSVASDPEMVEIIDGYTQEVNHLVSYFTDSKFNNILDIVAKADFPLETLELQESPFGNFVTDAMRLITAEKLGKRVDVAVQANGAIRGSLYPGTMDYSKDQISFYDLSALISLGYGSDGYGGYPIMSFYLTGEELRRALEVAALLAELKGDTYFLQFSGLKYEYNPTDTVLLNIPIIDTPLPSTRAVKNAQLYIGEGIQSLDDQGYVSLDRGDETLYHVVSDSYILSFLPMAGDLLPQLTIAPKDEFGNPVDLDDFEKLIVYNNGRQLKLWQTVIEYAASFEGDTSGVSIIPSYYSATMNRIKPITTIPLIVWPILILLVIASLIVVLVRRRGLRKRRTFKQ